METRLNLPAKPLLRLLLRQIIRGISKRLEFVHLFTLFFQKLGCPSCLKINLTLELPAKMAETLLEILQNSCTIEEIHLHKKQSQVYF
ncbi:hypothetical protein L6452_13354 [Arctium lappa]|uniref:Uncharacterized protein n=1 Tax=Arctium lappa TaxID=4217 RepID=A0ACB9CHZ9_ARCLA|nr:hypothetical protein L6452_13354 [Arctium lappa]